MEYRIGQIAWVDLTVPDAENARSFYEEVVGWKTSGQPVDDYEDYNLHLPETDETIAGICHQRGPNANLPAQWMIYISVEDLQASMDAVRRLGGKVLEMRQFDERTAMAYIQDPQGAVCALWQQA